MSLPSFLHFFSRQRRKKTASHENRDSLDHRLVWEFTRGKRVPTPKQIKHLPRFLSPKEKRSVLILFGIFTLAVFALGAKFMSDHIVTIPARGGDYVEAVVGHPRFINPLFASANSVDNDLVHLVFSGLVRPTPEGKLIPDLAENIEISDDGKIYTFRLRKNIRWHDGSALAARDVAQTFNLIKDPMWKSPLFSQFKNVELETPDDYTVVFRLSEPFAPFLSLLTVGIIPSHLWAPIKPENATRAELNIKPVGTGPYKFASFAKDKNGAILSYTLTRNEDYFLRSGYLQTITFKFYSDFAAAQDAVLRRNAHGLHFLPRDYRSDVEKQQSLRFTPMRLPQYTAVFFNDKKNSALKSRSLRQALTYALDREAIVRNTVGTEAMLVDAPILPGFIGFHPEIKKYTYDFEKAKKIIEQEKTPPKITLTTVDTLENIAVAEKIKEGWEAAGVEVQLQLIPAMNIQKEIIRTREYEALLYGEIMGSDPDPFPFWHSSRINASGLNLTSFAHRRADELLEKARVSTNQEDREKMYREFQDILVEEAPAIFLYNPAYTYVVSRKVQGITPGIIFTPADRFATITEWYTETTRVWK